MFYKKMILLIQLFGPANHLYGPVIVSGPVVLEVIASPHLLECH